MSKARFYLKQTKKKNIETLILLTFNYKYNRFRISTEISIKPNHWNSKEKVAKQRRGYTDEVDDINSKLKDRRNAIEKAYETFIKIGKIPTPSQLKEEYINQLRPEAINDKPEFWSIYSKYIESSQGRVVNDVIKDYKSLEKHLKGYEKNMMVCMDFDLFDFAFYQQFVHYLTYDVIKPNEEKGLATNTVGKQIKNLKAFLNYCFKHNLVERFDLSNFKTITEDTDAIYVTEDEITSIFNKDLSDKPELSESRDLFVLGCQIGLRSKDLFRLAPEMLNNDMIRIKMHKSNKPVVIPLQPLAKEIISKYKGDFPNKNNRNTFNADIKKVGKLAEVNSDIVITQKKGVEKLDKSYKKYELMSSHTCRRSFCTNQYLKGVPTVLLMKISGHKTEKAFLRYIKIDEEMAAKKIMEYWNNNNEDSN